MAVLSLLSTGTVDNAECSVAPILANNITLSLVLISPAVYYFYFPSPFRPTAKPTKA